MYATHHYTVLHHDPAAEAAVVLAGTAIILTAALTKVAASNPLAAAGVVAASLVAIGVVNHCGRGKKHLLGRTVGAVIKAFGAAVATVSTASDTPVLPLRVTPSVQDMRIPSDAQRRLRAVLDECRVAPQYAEVA